MSKARPSLVRRAHTHCDTSELAASTFLAWLTIRQAPEKVLVGGMSPLRDGRDEHCAQFRGASANAHHCRPPLREQNGTEVPHPYDTYYTALCAVLRARLKVAPLKVDRFHLGKGNPLFPLFVGDKDVIGV